MRPANTVAMLTAAVFAISIAGCSPFDARLGETVRLNAAQQIINPEPVFAGTDIEGGSGTQAALAAKRYRTDTVKPPISIRTTRSISGSGANASSGGQ